MDNNKDTDKAIATSEAASPPVDALLAPPGELVNLDPCLLHFRQAASRVEMQKDGETDWREVRLARLFPLTQPEKYISVTNKDKKEYGVLPDLNGLDSESLACVRAELRRRYLVPEIQRILACRDRYDLAEWTVETDRGRVTFMTRHIRDNVQQPLPRRLALTDVEGNRYDIPDTEALDAESQRLLDERL